MNRSQSIEIQLADGTGQPLHLGNVVTELHFFTGGRFRYAFKVGRTDEIGHLSTSYGNIEVLRRANATENLMDYNTRLEDCDSTVKVVVPSQEHLAKQYESAVRAYHQAPAWARIWPSNAKVKAEERSVQLTEEVTRVCVLASLNEETDGK
jgi:hypothetical protein